MRLFATIFLALVMFGAPARAGDRRDGGKLLLTEGVTSVEGASGGGLATWATIAGRETDAGLGANLHVTHVPLPDFSLTSFGGAIGVHDRIELSFARQTFDTRAAGAALGLGRGFTFGQDILGAKVRVAGDAVYSRVLPQISIGFQHKIARRDAVIKAVGGRRASGTDFYIAATKVLLAQSLVLNATVRATRANQFGLLGFGGDRAGGGAYTAQFEGSAGVLLARNMLVGAELRTKPTKLNFAREDKAYDAFVAWSPRRHVTVTAAYVDLGSIATVERQRGAFLSLQTSF